MRVRTAAAVILLAAAISCEAASADGGDWKVLLGEAKANAKASEHAKAAEQFGGALAAVQKAGDLAGAHEVANAFFEFLEGLREEPPREGGGSSVVFGPRAARAAVMSRLDPERLDGLVSAPCLAGELLREAVGRGDGAYISEAAAALEPHARGTKSGGGLKVLALLARGLKEAAAGDARAAITLVSVGDAAGRQDWTDLAMAADVELAAVYLKGEDEAKASATVARLAKTVSPSVDRRFLVWCRDALRHRLKDAPPEVIRPFLDAVGPILQKVEPGGAGGSGGAGTDSERPTSPLGIALRNPSKTKPLATVSRTAKGFEMTVAWNPKFRGAYEKASGVGYLDDGGLTLAFANWAVGVALVDVKGTEPGPPGLHETRPGQAYYRLAPSEIWTLHSDGSVKISAK